MNIRLICTDLDGTLFGLHGSLPEINRSALVECEKRGIHVALVSGRGFPMMKRLSGEIGIRAALASANGARIDASPDGPTLYEGFFEKQKAEELMALLMSLHVNFEAYTRGANYVSRPELMPERHKRGLLANIQAGDIEVVYDDGRMLKEAAHCSYKLVAFSEKTEDIEKVRRALDERGIAHCSSGRQNVEIMPEGIDKGRALSRLSEYFGVSREETMAFGDFTNDISMLKAAGHPVAMENAVDEMKRIAEIIAPVHTEGGLGQVLYRYVLKQEG